VEGKRLRADSTCYKFAEGAGHEGCTFQELIVVGVAGLGYSSEDSGSKGGGNEGKEGCGLECEAKSKTHETATLFRCIPSGVVKSVGRK
jgi:hypothetical protein